MFVLTKTCYLFRVRVIKRVISAPFYSTKMESLNGMDLSFTYAWFNNTLRQLGLSIGDKMVAC